MKSRANFQPFKYFVGYGNNSVLVLQALKRRFWWTAGWRDEDDWEDYNFIWTQWRRNPIIKALKQEKDIPSTHTFSKKNGSNSDDLTTCLTENFPSEEEKITTSKLFERNLSPSKSWILKTQSKKIQNIKGDNLTQMDPSTLCENIMYNHLEGNFHLSNK